MNKQSLHKLKNIAEEHNIKYLCTGHSGIRTEMDNIFSHIDESAEFSKTCPFDEYGPDDFTK